LQKSSYELDAALLQWFNQKLAEEMSVSGLMCAHKAKFSNEEACMSEMTNLANVLKGLKNQ
jgi:hypothetical protein